MLHAGDLFHHWKASPYLVAQTMSALPEKFHTVYGNHDLPYHRLDNADHSGIYPLVIADRINTEYGCHWGIKPEEAVPFILRYVPSDPDMLRANRKVLIWHKFVYKSKKPFPDAKESDEVYNILGREDLKGYDLIVTGDNHQNFISERDGILLVNAGPITRQTIKDNEPVVYLYYADDHYVEEHPIPCEPDAVSAVHREMAIREEQVMSAFVERLDKDWKVELSYGSNMERCIESNPEVTDEVATIIYKCMEKENANV